MGYYILSLLVLGCHVLEATFITDTLTNAKAETRAAIDRIRKEWDIDHYPNFLMSCQMHKSSWEILKFRFINTIANAIGDNSLDNTDFLIAFMGSSVAAGHDSKYDKAYPLVTGTLMKSSFNAAGINLLVTNNAVANNPCMPYDSCVATYAGQNADIVHFEHSMNCFEPPMYEQFVRQASFLSKNPIVIYSESQTHNW